MITIENEREITEMKFYSYTNENNNYTKAISLDGIRSIERVGGSGKSTIRFSVILVYFNGSSEALNYLLEEESKKVYKEILDLLNNN